MEAQSIYALLFLLIIVIGAIFYVAFWPGVRQRRIMRQAFPDHWLSTLRRRLPFYDALPQAEQQRLQNLIKRFLSDHQFIGCAGLEINDEIRVTVAAQACLLILNKKGYHFQKLRSILVYPSTFVAVREVRDDLGLISTRHTALLGESWDQGKVVLAWDNVEKSVRNLEDGHNVVLHEFAHQLDSESGVVNGAPILQTRGAYKSWAQVLNREYEKLNLGNAQDYKSLLDEYGGTNPAEFFAVATETFFERPIEMAEHHQELFQELEKYYQLDPTQWKS